MIILNYNLNSLHIDRRYHEMNRLDLLVLLGLFIEEFVILKMLWKHLWRFDIFKDRLRVFLQRFLKVS